MYLVKHEMSSVAFDSKIFFHSADSSSKFPFDDFVIVSIIKFLILVKFLDIFCSSCDKASKLKVC